MRMSYYLLSLSLFLTLIQCGGDAGPSGKVEISVSPSSPVVITSDLTIPVGDTEFTVTGPYIVIYITVANNSTEHLNISGIRFEATYESTDENGVTTTLTAGPTDMGPSSLASLGYSYIKTTATCDITTCDQTLFLDLSPGESRTITVSASGADRHLRFFLGNLPTSDGKNFVYRMKLTPLGFFGSQSNVTNRLTKSIYFNTL